MASRQGFGELKTEQLGGHSQEQQRHRQAPIDDDDDESLFSLFSVSYSINRHKILQYLFSIIPPRGSVTAVRVSASYSIAPTYLHVPPVELSIFSLQYRYNDHIMID